MIKSITAKLSLVVLLISITTCYYEREINEELEICYQGGNGLYLMNMDGSNKRRITFNNLDINPSWSPDGKTILFNSLSPAIFSINSDGSGLKQLISIGFDPVTCPTWSSDGKLILFTSQISSLDYIFIADINGNIITKIDPYPYSPQYTTMSHDKNYIFFTDRTTPEQLHRLNINTNQQVSIGNYDPYSSTSLSPDGKILACTYNSNQIVFVSTEGTATSHTFFTTGSSPCWTPDGKTIVYVSTSGDIYSINIDGTNNKPLTTGGGCSEPCVQGKPK